MSSVPPSRPLRWVSWAAVSSLPQAKKISIEDQLAVNREHMERHGGQLVEEMIVPGESRSIVLFEDAAQRISAYARLHELIRARAFDVLVYLDRSRLGRKASLSMTVVELCHAAGIATYETENPPNEVKVNTGHDDMIVGAIKSVGAQREIQKLVERNTIGMIGRIRKGEMPNHIVYGYRREFAPDGTRRIVVDEMAAGVVRKIFELYLAGVGTPGIADHFNGQGIRTPTGQEWSKIAAIRIMDRVWRYAGYTEINRQSATGRQYVRARGNWSPIISEETAEAVEREREMRAHNRHLPDATDILAGVCHCAVCGGPMSIFRTSAPTAQGAVRYDYYRCNRHRPAQYVRVEFAFASLRAAIDGLQDADLETVLDEDDVDPVAPLAAQVDAQEEVIARLSAALQRVDDAYAMGVLDLERYQHQVEKLKAQMQSARAERVRLHETMDTERARGTRRQRVEELVQYGLEMLSAPSGAPARTNAWFRHHVRLWSVGGRIVEVEFL